MGPAYNVPHMLLTITSDSQDVMTVFADYVVRGPTPIGTDNTIVETYYGKEVVAWYDKAVSSSGAVVLPPPFSFSARLLRSPVALSVGGLTAKDATNIANEHVTRWINWVAAATQVEARQRGAMNGRDDKLRQFAFRAALAESSKIVTNSFATTLAAASTGPIAEAYVGGGS